MAREKKFYFSPISMSAPEDTYVGKTATISIFKNGQMFVPKLTVRKYNLDNTLVDILWDEKKRAFGLRRMDSLPEGEWTKTMRLLKTDKQGNIKVAIGRIMTRIGIAGENYAGLEVGEYNDLMEKQQILYVVVPKQKKTRQDDLELSTETQLESLTQGQ